MIFRSDHDEARNHNVMFVLQYTIQGLACLFPDFLVRSSSSGEPSTTSPPTFSHHKFGVVKPTRTKPPHGDKIQEFFAGVLRLRLQAGSLLSKKGSSHAFFSLEL